MCTFSRSLAALKAIVRRVMHDLRRTACTAGMSPAMESVAEAASANQKFGGSELHIHNNNGRKTKEEARRWHREAWRSFAVESRETRRRYHPCEILPGSHNKSVARRRLTRAQ